MRTTCCRAAISLRLSLCALPLLSSTIARAAEPPRATDQSPYVQETAVSATPEASSQVWKGESVQSLLLAQADQNAVTRVEQGKEESEKKTEQLEEVVV